MEPAPSDLPLQLDSFFILYINKEFCTFSIDPGKRPAAPKARVVVVDRSGSGPISSRAARPCARVRSAPLGHLRARSRRGSGARLVSRGTRLSDYRAVLGTRPLPSCPASRRGLTARARHTHTLQTRPARNRFLLVVLRQIRVCSRRNAYAN